MLRLVGISPTYQRVQIADLVFQYQQHVTTEEVYEQLNTKCRSVSRASVYNTLKRLVNRDLLWQVTVELSRVFYNSSISPHHYCHLFFDIDSGELEDIDAEQFEILGISEPVPGKNVAGVDVVVRLKSTG